MGQLRIVFFNRSFYPDTAATGQLLTDLCEDLVHEHGCEVSVVAGVPLHPASGNGQQAERGILHDREEYRGIHIIRAKGTRFSKERFVGRASNYISYFLSAALNGDRGMHPDIVVSLTDPPIVGLAALKAARRFGAKFVFLCQDIFPEVAVMLSDFRSNIANAMLQRVSRKLVREADRIVAVGETMRDRLVQTKNADPAIITVIHNWADCTRIQPASRKSAFSTANGLDGKFVVMHSGNIGLSQSLETLVDAAVLLQDYRDILIVLVGEGAKKRDLQQRVETLNLKNVLFLPYQPKEELSESFAAADVFVVSLKAGMAGYIVPSKIYGILAAGRPYVAAVEEESEVMAITRKHNCGLTARPGDGKDLADRILELYRDRDLAQKMGERARQAAVEFDRPQQVRAYYELFRELTSKS